MPIGTSIKDILKNPPARRVWVVAELRRRGTSLSAIAKREGVSDQAVGQALTTPSERMEKVLARELEIEVKDLFPERFDRHGTRTVRSNPIAAQARLHAKPKKVA